MPHAILQYSSYYNLTNKEWQKTCALDFGVHYYKFLVRVISNSTITRVTCELITTQRLTTPDIAITLDEIGIFDNPKMPEIRSIEKNH
jgi:hypothetical protein